MSSSGSAKGPKQRRIVSAKLNDLDSSHRTLVQLNSAQWFLVLLFSIAFVVFIVRPASFLVQGFALDIPPPLSFRTLNYVLVFAKIVFFFITVLFLTYQISELFGKFLYGIVAAFTVCVSFGVVVLLIVYSTSCNSQSNPGNPCNSNLYCCHFGSLVPECQSILFPAPVCPVSPYALASLTPNPVFIEYFVWIGVFLIMEAIMIYIQAMYIMTIEDITVESRTKDSEKAERISGKIKLKNKKGTLDRDDEILFKDYSNPSSAAAVELESQPEYQYTYDDKNHSVIHDILKSACNTMLNVSRKYIQPSIYPPSIRQRKNNKSN